MCYLQIFRQAFNRSFALNGMKVIYLVYCPKKITILYSNIMYLYMYFEFNKLNTLVLKIHSFIKLQNLIVIINQLLFTLK